MMNDTRSMLGAAKTSYQLRDAFRQASFMATALQIHSTSNYNKYFVKKNGWMQDYKLAVVLLTHRPLQVFWNLPDSIKPTSLVACIIQS